MPQALLRFRLILSEERTAIRCPIMDTMEPQHIRPGHLTAAQTRAALGGISAGALRQLVYRGQLTRSGGTERHPYYAIPDVTALALKRRQRTAA